MSFSSRRRNYLLRPHRTDGLIDWMKGMLMHSFVLDALDTTGADTFSHFEELIDEHIEICQENNNINGGTSGNVVSSDCSVPGDSSNNVALSRLKQLVPTIGIFHTRLPLRQAFEAYNVKHRLTKRKHIYISFNEIRHILNLAQIMAMRKTSTTRNTMNDAELLKSTRNVKEMLPVPGTTTTSNEKDEPAGSNDDEFDGPKMITFDGDQTLYSDGANFEENQELATYLYLLLKHKCVVAVVTAAGYEYVVEKYQLRLSGLLDFFRDNGLTQEECDRFYLFGGECNYLLKLGPDYNLQPVKEYGPGGWKTATIFLKQDGPGNWKESDVKQLLDVSEESLNGSLTDQNLRARVIRKKRAVGLIPLPGYSPIPREALDETVLRVQNVLGNTNTKDIPYCAFNGGRDVWVDIGNKRCGVQVLSAYLGIPANKTLHIGDQFLNTGNDYAARDVCPCIWITSPEETTYILKSILRLAKVSINTELYTTANSNSSDDDDDDDKNDENQQGANGTGGVNFTEAERRSKIIMDVYTGEIIKKTHGTNSS